MTRAEAAGAGAWSFSRLARHVRSSVGEVDSCLTRPDYLPPAFATVKATSLRLSALRHHQCSRRLALSPLEKVLSLSVSAWSQRDFPPES